MPHFENSVLRNFGTAHPSAPLNQLKRLDAIIEEHWFDALDKKSRLFGCLIRNKQNNGGSVLLFCSGRVTSVGDTHRYVQWMLDAGHSVFVFDYRGVGASPGWATFAGIHADGLAAYDFLLSTKCFSQNRIGIYGQSLGGFVAAFVSCQRNITTGVLCLQSTGDTMLGIAKRREAFLRIFPDFLFPQPRMNNVALVTLSQRPLVIIHGEQDVDKQLNEQGDEVPGFSSQCALNLFAAGKHSRSQLFLLPNSGHLNLGDTDHALYIEALLKVRDTLAISPAVA